MADADYEREARWEEPTALVESLVRAASEYVQPSDDLRPRTLEAAREQRGQQKAWRCIGGLSVAVLFLASLGLPSRYLSSRANVTGVSPFIASAYELHVRALQRAPESKIDPSWALLDVFTELRHSQANLFNESL